MSGCFCQKMAGNGPGMGKYRQNALSGPLHGMIPPKIAFFNLKISFLTQKKVSPEYLVSAKIVS